VHDREEPAPRIVPLAPAVEPAESALQAVLDEVVGRVAVAQKGARLPSSSRPSDPAGGRWSSGLNQNAVELKLFPVQFNQIECIDPINSFDLSTRSITECFKRRSHHAHQ